MECLQSVFPDQDDLPALNVISNKPTETQRDRDRQTETETDNQTERPLCAGRKKAVAMECLQSVFPDPDDLAALNISSNKPKDKSNGVDALHVQCDKLSEENQVRPLISASLVQRLRKGPCVST